VKRTLLTIAPAVAIALAVLIGTSSTASASHVSFCSPSQNQLRGNYGYGPEFR
jgi:hypothetical protein